MIKKIVIVFICVTILTSYGKGMAEDTVGRIEEGVLKATVKIETPSGDFGTGFIVSKPAKDDSHYFFLVTNKHLVGKYLLFDGIIKDYYDFITISCYKKDKSIQRINIPLKNSEGKINSLKVFPYPKPHIDIVLISIADDLEKVPDLDKFSFDLSYFATNEVLKKWNIDIGDQVFALGYPYNIYSQSNYYPIAKSGYISSKIGEELFIKVPHKDENDETIFRELKGKIILLDGTLVPGNSGGPIIIPRGRRERSKVGTDDVELTTKSIPNLVIGIQSQSYLKASVSVAFSSEYILELVDMIFQNK